MGVLVLPLSQGLIAVVDDADAHLAEHVWSAAERERRWYAVREDDGRHVYLHRAVMGEPPSPDTPHVDHRNGYGLDCRRANLRWVPEVVNHYNHGVTQANTSGYLGVAASPRTRLPWRAFINDTPGHARHLGTFATAHEAHLARLAAEKELWGVQPRRSAVFEEAGLA